MIWDAILKTQRQAKYPTENFVRFVARNYYDAPDRSKISFLDLGCGAGANARYLRAEGFLVFTVDKSPEAHADFTFDLSLPAWPIPARFDCVLDNNTFCHLEHPPIGMAHLLLKDGGIFFSVCPTSETWRGHLVGKGYCRCATNDEIRDLFHGFSNVQIGYACYPQDGHTISSWIVEAEK